MGRGDTSARQSVLAACLLRPPPTRRPAPAPLPRPAVQVEPAGRGGSVCGGRQDAAQEGAGVDDHAGLPWWVSWGCRAAPKAGQGGAAAVPRRPWRSQPPPLPTPTSHHSRPPARLPRCRAADVYVASVSLEANYNQVVKAMAEAEAHPGPSLLIAYSPCAMHGIASMGSSASDAKLAVDSGASRAAVLWGGRAGGPAGCGGCLLRRALRAGRRMPHSTRPCPRSAPVPTRRLLAAVPLPPRGGRGRRPAGAGLQEDQGRAGGVFEAGEQVRRGGGVCEVVLCEGLAEERVQDLVEPHGTQACAATSHTLPTLPPAPRRPPGSWCSRARTPRLLRRCTTRWTETSTCATSASPPWPRSPRSRPRAATAATAPPRRPRSEASAGHEQARKARC